MKYLLFIILGILIFIFFNNYNTFSIGGPDGQESDDEESYVQRLQGFISICLSMIPYSPIITTPNSDLVEDTLLEGDVVQIDVREFYDQGYHDNPNRLRMIRQDTTNLAYDFAVELAAVDRNMEEVDILYGYVRNPNDPDYAEEYPDDQIALLDIYRQQDLVNIQTFNEEHLNPALSRLHAAQILDQYQVIDYDVILRIAGQLDQHQAPRMTQPPQPFIPGMALEHNYFEVLDINSDCANPYNILSLFYRIIQRTEQGTADIQEIDDNDESDDVRRDDRRAGGGRSAGRGYHRPSYHGVCGTDP